MSDFPPEVVSASYIRAPPRSCQEPGSSPTTAGVLAPRPNARFASELATRTRAPLAYVKHRDTLPGILPAVPGASRRARAGIRT